MNSKKIITIIFILCCVTAIIISGNMFVVSTLLVKDINVRIMPFENQSQFDEYIDFIERNKGNENYSCYNELNKESGNYKDYCFVLLDVTFKNRSFITTQAKDADLIGDVPENIIFKRPIAFPTVMYAFEAKDSEDCYDFLCYKGDLSDEELISKFNGLKLKICYDNDLFKNLTKTIRIEGIS